MNTRSRLLPFVLGVPFFLILALVNCSDDNGPTTPTTPDDGVRTPQTLVVASNPDTTLKHTAGSFLRVQRWSVPLTADSATGEMLFTIEVGPPSTFNVPETPPEHWRVVTDIHSMGPEGFVFDMPVKASIPLPEGFDPAKEDALMYDYDRAGQRWESVGGQFSADWKSIEVDGVHLCLNRLLAQQWSERGTGAVKFQCLVGYSFKICIESYTLKYPEWENFDATNRIAYIDRADASTTPRDGLQYWRLPQGTYRLSIEVYRHDYNDPMLRPVYLGYFQKDVTIDRPHWNWQQGGTAPDYEYAVFFGDLTPYTNPNVLTQGRPSCFAAPTPSVGVGSLNFRLEWSAVADLDLWVTDPCGNRIYFGNMRDTCQESIGRLDLDNRCSNFVLGRPENIYWSTSPPRGAYKVEVDYFSDCGEGTGGVYYTLRWTMRGASQSKSGTIQPNETITVLQMTY
jgi:hypothetical protein